MNRKKYRRAVLLLLVVLLAQFARGPVVLAANQQKTNKNANIGVVYWWSYGGKVDWLADGYKSRASIFYDKKDGLLTYCANQEKPFTTDKDTAMSKASAGDASQISGLEWLGDLDRKYRAAFILDYGYSNTASAVESALESSDGPMWRYGVTQLLIWANAKGYWDDAAQMKKIRKNATTQMGVDASASTIGAYWDDIVSSVNTAMAKALKKPTNRHAGLIIYMGKSDQQEQIALSTDFTISTGEAYVAKSSAVPDLTKGNGLYVLKGTQYGVYLTEADAKAHTNEIATLTAGDDGKTGTVTLEAGRTYWYSEIKAGTGYLKDASAKTPVSFTVGKGKTKKITAKDAPIASSAKVQIQKTSGGNLITEGSAIFQVDFFTDKAEKIMGQKDPAPERTWYFGTEQGVLDLRDPERLLASFQEQESDSLFTDADGNVVLPLGTVRVREVQAPEGYLASAQEFFGEITVNSKKTGATFTWVSPAEGDLSIAKLVASLENEEDKKPQIHTTAVCGDTERHIGSFGPETRIKDTVTYENLVPGQTYEVHGQLMISGTGEPYLDASGGPVTAASEPFTIQEGEESGMVELWFLFNGSNLDGVQLTAYEDLYSNGAVVAQHRDPDDVEQTVQYPQIRTTAHLPDSDEKTALAEEKMQIVDTVSYRNLIPGETYTLTAYIYNRTADKMLGEEGETLYRFIEFTPDEPDGTVDVRIELNASDLGGSDLVVCELLTIGGVGIAAHTDFDDADQTIHVEERTTDLTISKTVQGSGGNKLEAFLFTLRMSYKDKPLKGSFPAYDEDGKELKPVSFTDGKATFLLAHGQSITIQDLPVHTVYELTEESGSYEAKIDAPEGTLSLEPTQIHCINDREEIVPTGLKGFLWKIPAGTLLCALALLLGALKWKKIKAHDLKREIVLKK